MDFAAEAADSVWLDANRYYEAEGQHEMSETELCKRANPGFSPPHGMLRSSSLASEIAYARQKIQNFLKSGDSGIDINSGSLVNRLEKVEKEQEVMKKQIEVLTSQMADVLSQLTVINNYIKQGNSPVKANTQVPKKDNSSIQNGSPAGADDDDLDLFGSDEESEDAAKLKEERLQAYANKKDKKSAAKSSVVLDVKPWDDETDMKAVEKAVRAIETDGLLWGASKLVPLAYGINKFQIVAIVEDEKVSIDWLQETISEVEDLVQSVDIAAFNKL